MKYRNPRHGPVRPPPDRIPDPAGWGYAGSCLTPETGEPAAVELGTVVGVILNELLPARAKARAEAERVLAAVEAAGCVVAVEHGAGRYRPAAAVGPALAVAFAANRAGIEELLDERQGGG